MSYLVFARKYRPMFFDDVIGQNHVTQTLQNAIEQNRIANAYLFSGPRGVGKTTVARILAKALNCDQGTSIHPCNTCSSCVEINESRSLDVLEIDGASNRGIDEVRNLRESLRYSPNPGKYRIFIIDEVHMLTNEAFNALLKTLEEPPSHVLFIFATTEPHKVPTTILSRCQRFDFKRIPTKQIIAQLDELCRQETIEIDEESIRLIANKGDGSMRDAESILDQVIAYAGETVNADDTVNLLGIIQQDLFFKVTDLIKENDVHAGLELIQHIFSEGYDYNEFLIGLSEHFRNFLIVKATKKVDELEVSEEHAKRYLSERDDFEIEDLLRLLKISSDAENLLRRSTNARLHLEIALVKMIKLTTSVQLSDLLAQFEEIKKKSDSPNHPTLASSPTVSPQKTSADTETISKGSPNDSNQSMPRENIKIENKNSEKSEHVTDVEKDLPELTFQEVEGKWPQVVEKIKTEKIALGALLVAAWPFRFNGITIELAFETSNGFYRSSVESQIKDVEEIIRHIYGRDLRLKCISVQKQELDKVHKIPVRADRKTEFEKVIEEDSVARDIMDTFDAEFVK